MKDKIRNLALGIYEDVCIANEIFVDKKLIEDYKKSIKGIKINQDIEKEEEIYLKNKILMLKLELRNKMSEFIRKRREKQNLAIAKIKLLDYYVELSYNQKNINIKKQENWSKKLTEVEKLLKGWMKSDIRRFSI